VRIPRNINTDVDDAKREIASDIIKIRNDFSCKNTGNPVSLLPPGTVKAAVNITVMIRAPTTVDEVATCFIHFSPAAINFSWLLVNNWPGVSPF
jgi:hypothetical protein